MAFEIEVIVDVGMDAEANFCRVFIRLKRDIARSRRRKGRWLFSTLLLAQRPTSCFMLVAQVLHCSAVGSQAVGGDCLGRAVALQRLLHEGERGGPYRGFS